VSLFRIKKDVEIKYSKYGKKAGVIGASCYMVSEFTKNIFQTAD